MTNLVVSMSGLATATLVPARRLAGELDDRGVPLSLLIVPSRLEPRCAALGWLRDRADGADALLLHGADPRSGRSRWRAAQFALLPAHEARLKLLAARAAMERLGLHSNCFVPPGWLASPGTLDALRRNSFRLCAELHGVRDLALGAMRSSRLLGFGGSWRTEPWRGLVSILGAGWMARNGRLVRLAVDAADLDRSGVWRGLLDAVDLALHHGARPVTYQSLIAPVSVPH